MMFFNEDSIDENVSRTDRLEYQSQKIIKTLKEGNSWKIGNGLGAIAGVIGLCFAGGGVVSPFVGLLLLTSLLSSITSYFSYCLDEAAELGINPLLIPLIGGEESSALSELLTDAEKSHWDLIEVFGVPKVKQIEAAGLLDSLVEAVQDIDLSNVEDDDRIRIYKQELKQIKDSVTLFPKPQGLGSDRPSRQRNLPTSNPVDPWGTEGTSDRLTLPVATTSKPFDWSTITRRPHLFVLGDTGSGKTCLVQWLLANHYPKDSEVLVLDPHDRKGQWGHHPTIGRGRNFPAIELALEKLVAEMDRRYSSGDYNHQAQIVVIEEMPAIAANCKTATASIACLTLEARKVGIFLIVLSQGWEVDSIGIKGKGSIRKSFLFISLGEFALDKAKQLDTGLLQQLKDCDRPCLVGDELAIIPNFAASPPADIRSSLDRLLERTAIEPTPIAQTEPLATPSKIDSLDDKTLDELLAKVLDYAKRKGAINPSDVTNNNRSLREYSAPDILRLFNYLEGEGHGTVRGGKFTPD